MARSSNRGSASIRWWLAAAGLVCSVAVIAAAPASAGSPPQSAGVSVRSSAVVLAGALAPTGGLSGPYPTAPGPSWPAVTTPGSRFAATVDGRTLAVACLDICRSAVPTAYTAAPTLDVPVVTRILGAARTVPGRLGDGAEAAAEQAAIWFVTVGFVLDAGVDPAVRARVADLVAAPSDPVRADGAWSAGTVLVGDDPSAPRLVLTEGGDPAAAHGASGPQSSAALARDPLNVAADAASTPNSNTTSGAVSSSTTSTTGTSTTGTSTTGTSTTGTSTTGTSTTGTSTQGTGSPTASSSTSTISSTSTSTGPSSTGTTIHTVVTISFRNCAAVWSSISRPLTSPEPGYAPDLDSDHDGIACEQPPTYTNPASTTDPAAGGTDSSGDPLASTGFGIGRALAAGGALVLLGGSMLIAARPRRSSPTHLHGR